MAIHTHEQAIAFSTGRSVYRLMKQAEKFHFSVGSYESTLRTKGENVTITLHHWPNVDNGIDSITSAIRVDGASCQ